MPVVADPPSRDLGLYAFMALLGIGGIGLFALLASGRDDANAPATNVIAADGARIEAPPPLALPDAYLRYAPRDLPPAPSRFEPPVPASGPAVPVARAPAPIRRVQPVPDQPRQVAPAPIRPVRPLAQNVQQPPYERSVDGPAGSSVAGDGDRVLATRFLNPGVTVPKGTIIPAVLETALDSTRPGGVRALIQRDVHGFDGSRVVIPRGSRLYGEYATELEQGEKRALVTWTRLMRPDGVMIALESPASDPLGRAGIRGRVDSKFLQRFGNAILQSALDVGIGVAAAEATGGVVVAVPGVGGSRVPQVSENRQIRPTLTVAHGTSVSVFVAKDLDFSSVGG